MQEANRFTEALKDAEFRESLLDYMRALSNPEERREQEVRENRAVLTPCASTAYTRH
jgi:hypothetical protein